MVSYYTFSGMYWCRVNTADCWWLETNQLRPASRQTKSQQLQNILGHSEEHSLSS